jgi:hypothetical protein
MTGIYILKTKDGYRVSKSEQFVDLLGKYNDDTLNYDVDPVILHQMFDGSKFFPIYFTALEYAHRISSTCKETDDGIFIIKNCENLNYWEIK